VRNKRSNKQAAILICNAVPSAKNHSHGPEPLARGNARVCWWWPMNTLQQIYDSEINFELRSHWSTGFEWKLGDHLNGYLAKGHADSVKGAADALAQAACEHFPASKFAQARRRFA